MGLFGTQTQTVAITQAANGGKSIAEIEHPIPLWEIVIICVITIVMLYIMKRLCQRSAENFLTQHIQRARTLEGLNNINNGDAV